MQISEVENQRIQVKVCQICAYHVLGSNIETGHGSNYFRHPCMFALVLEFHVKVLRREGGSKLISPKIEFWGLWARVAFLARSFWDNFWPYTKLLYLTDFFHIVIYFPLKAHLWKLDCPSSPPSLIFRYFCVSLLFFSGVTKGYLLQWRQYYPREQSSAELSKVS